jgi:thiamine biosynthesis lipoprotein
MMVIMNKYFLLFLLLAGCLISGCRQKQYPLDRFSGLAQGSTYSIVFENCINISPDELKREVDKIFHDFDMSLSVYNDSSIISKVNRNEEVILDTFFLAVINISSEISLHTDGAFDITVGPLVRAWGFGPDAHKNFDRSKLDSLKNLVGFRKISVRGNRLVKSSPGMKIDVNAIAQGYSADVLYRYFTGRGLRNFLIEIGGEVRVKGNKNGEGWKIGIDKPEDNNLSPGEKIQAIIKIKDKALATSGNYRKFYVENGIKYAHHIDPKTGYPTKNTLLSVTLIADDCATADGTATACFVMGVEKTIEFLHNNPELEAYLIYSDEKGNYVTWTTENLKKNIAKNSQD